MSSELYRERFPATPQAVRRARHDVLEALARSGFDDPQLLSDVALTVSEAVANAVRHAYPADDSAGEIDVTLTQAGEHIIVTVQDTGVGIGTHSSSDGLGLGLPIMHAQTDHLDVTSDTTGTTLSLRFKLP